MSFTDGLKEKRLALFFTLGISLQLWEQMGHLSRESGIYKRLADHLGEVYFLTYGTKDMDYASRIGPIKILHKPPGIPVKLYSFFMPLAHWRPLKKVDFLKTNQMKGAWAAVVAKLLFRKKLIVRCGYEWELFAKEGTRSKLKLWLIHLIEWICYRFADAIILASEEMKRYVCNTFGISPTKVTVIPNYIDTELFRPMAVEKVQGRLVFVGRFSPQKNPLTLLRAIEGLPNIELVLVGDGPLEKSLREYASKQKINVVFKGRVPNDQLPVLLNTAEAFVLPSLYEGNPKALLEAMACGCAVVGTNVKGIREIIANNENGLLCETDADSIKQAITKLMQDKNLRDRLGKNARRFIVEDCSLDKIVEKEINLYNTLINENA